MKLSMYTQVLCLHVQLYSCFPTHCLQTFTEVFNMLLWGVFQWMCYRSCSCGSVKLNTLSVLASTPHKRYSVWTCTVCCDIYTYVVCCTNHYLTCFMPGMSFLYWGMCKVTPHFGCSSVDMATNSKQSSHTGSNRHLRR